MRTEREEEYLYKVYVLSNDNELLQIQNDRLQAELKNERRWARFWMTVATGWLIVYIIQSCLGS